MQGASADSTIRADAHEVRNRDWLIANHTRLLRACGLCSDTLHLGSGKNPARIRQESGKNPARIRQESGKNYVVQESSGSANEPIAIPRSKTDIADIRDRVLSYYLREVGRAPSRIALCGGISHVQAASALDSSDRGIAIRSFQGADPDELAGFDPEIVSCYPSVARELMQNVRVRLSSIRAIKLGGERVFPADIRGITARFGSIPIIEQFGSTEMPAVAVRVHRAGQFARAFQLETGRFQFRFDSDSGWQRLIVKDCFPELMLPIGAFYDTGDDVLLEDSVVVDVRRRDDPANAYLGHFAELFERGCGNVQLVSGTDTLLYAGPIRLEPHLNWDGRRIATRHVQAIQTKTRSGKTPLVILGETLGSMRRLDQE